MTDNIEDPYENMALDEALLLLCDKNISPPTIRLYTWKPLVLSIGYAQNPLKELDTDLCKILNIPVVRRITGGKALIHNSDLSYSVVFHYDGALQRHSIVESQRVINYCLVNAIRKKGIDARLRLERKDPYESLSRLSKRKYHFCFLIPASNDIIVSDQKIVGSAQRRTRNAFIQHGSIFIDPPDDIEERIMKGPTKVDEGTGDFMLELLKEKYVQEDSQSSHTWINKYLLRRTNTQELKEIIIKSFEEGLGVKFHREELTGFETDVKEKLKKEKYMKDEWNFFRSKSLARQAGLFSVCP